MGAARIIALSRHSKRGHAVGDVIVHDGERLRIVSLLDRDIQHQRVLVEPVGTVLPMHRKGVSRRG